MGIAEGIVAAISALAAYMGRGSGSGTGAAGVDPALLDQMNSMIGVQKRNYLYTDPGASNLLNAPPPEGAVPLRRAVNHMAFALMPKWAREGTDPSLARNPPNYGPLTKDLGSITKTP